MLTFKCKLAELLITFRYLHKNMKRLPQNFIWNQGNRGDRLGDLYNSYNLDLTGELGSLRISPRLLLNVSSTDDANLGIPCAAKNFVANGFIYWAICGAYIYNSIAGLNTTFVKDTTSGTPTTCDPNLSDMKLLPDLGYLLVSGASTTVKFLKKDGTWNSCSSTLVDNAGLKAMSYFRGLNKVYIVDESSRSISSISNASTPAITAAAASTQYTLYHLVDGTVNRISWIRSTNFGVWIGTINFSGEPAKIYFWDGNTGANGLYVPNNVYTIQASGSLSCVIENDVPVVLDTKGRLLKLNGGTFEELDRLPFEDRTPTTTYVAYNATQQLIHYNGMEIIDGKINLLIRGYLYENGNPNKENLASGIWEYTTKTGLYHKNSIGRTKAADTIVDYGQQKILAVGCLESLDTPISVTYNGTYLAGIRYFINATSDGSTYYDGLFYNDKADTLQKAGSFTTIKLYSPNITDIWQKIYAIFGRRFLNATDKIVIKARNIENESTEATITYVNTTSFTVAASNFTIAPVVGDEVEILQGVGAGRCTHITAVSGTTTLTITVDETITGVTTQTAIARFQTWKKLGSYNAQTDDFSKLPIQSDQLGASTWIQFKVWILWTGKNKLSSLIISSKVNEAIE